MPDPAPQPELPTIQPDHLAHGQDRAAARFLTNVATPIAQAQAPILTPQDNLAGTILTDLIGHLTDHRPELERTDPAEASDQTMKSLEELVRSDLDSS
jgi:hypothetical protein